MTPPKPCCRCNARGVRNLYNSGYCARHLADRIATFKPQAFRGVGVGLPVDRVADIVDNAAAMLACNLCGATWVGRVLDTCSWCVEAVERQVEWQREMILAPPDVDHDDVRYEGALRGWADRMGNAVEAGIVDRAAAERAIEMAVRRATA